MFYLPGPQSKPSPATTPPSLPPLFFFSISLAFPTAPPRPGPCDHVHRVVQSALHGGLDASRSSSACLCFGASDDQKREGGRRKGGLAPPWDCARLCDAFSLFILSFLFLHPPPTHPQITQPGVEAHLTNGPLLSLPAPLGRRGRDFVLVQSPLPHVHVGSYPIDLSSQQASCLPLPRSPHQARGRQEAVRFLGKRRLGS